MSNHRSALVVVSAVSWSSLITISFVFCACLCSLLPLCLLLVSRSNHVPPWFYAFYHLSPACLLPCLPLIVSDTNVGGKSNWKRVAWENVACDSCCSHLKGIKNCQHQELVQAQTCTQMIWKNRLGPTGGVRSWKTIIYTPNSIILDFVRRVLAMG